MFNSHIENTIRRRAEVGSETKTAPNLIDWLGQYLKAPVAWALAARRSINSRLGVSWIGTRPKRSASRAFRRRARLAKSIDLTLIEVVEISPPAGALDADTDACLGLVAGEVWTRPGRVTVHHNKRPLEERESRRWLSTPEQAKEVLRAAAAVTVIDDREGDIYDKWASVSAQNFDLLTRSMHDRALADGRSLYAAAAAFPIADVSTVELMARANRPARRASALALVDDP
jgi:hypothetical protein